MKSLKFFVAAVAAIMALACTEEEVDVLTMGSTEINVSYQGAEQTLEFKASSAWTVESDMDWVTFDVTEGVAGDASVVMTVAANTTYEARTAVVTISAGTLFTEYVINQGFASEFGAEMEYDFDFMPQVLEVALNTNVEYSVSVSEGAESWITSDALSKAAPEKATITFAIALNSGDDRTGEITITAGETVQTIVVNQTAFEGSVMSSVSATYLGKTSYIYDAETYSYPEFDEHFLSFANEAGDELTISLNNAVLENPMAGIPTGEYIADASATHQASTFTLNDGSAKYYTSVTVSGVEIDVVDGSISVELEGKTYKIIAELYDDAGVSYGFAYVGEIPEMEDKSFAADVSPGFVGQYATYFTTKANKWTLGFYISKKSEDSDVFLRYLSVDIYSPENSDPTVLPEGTYTFTTASNDPDLTWANGTLLADPGMMTYLYGNDVEYNNVNSRDGEESKIVITKNADGTYNFALDLKLYNSYWDYDEDNNYVEFEISDFDYVAEFTNVEIGEIPSTGMTPVPDRDDVFSTVMSSQYVGMWWGDKWATGGSAFTIGFAGSAVNGVYEIYLTLNQAEEYVYEKNMSGRYCNTPLQEGTYTFSTTPAAGQMSLVPVKFGSANYCYVKNGYTGTKMPITGGSVTLTEEAITYNLETTVGDKVYKFTGSHPASLYYARDYTSRASNIVIVTE